MSLSDIKKIQLLTYTINFSQNHSTVYFGGEPDRLNLKKKVSRPINKMGGQENNLTSCSMEGCRLMIIILFSS